MNSITFSSMNSELIKIATAHKQAGIFEDVSTGVRKFLAPKAAPSVAALTASGTLKQMKAGRNFGGAAVDPFVKMRQEAVGRVKGPQQLAAN